MRENDLNWIGPRYTFRRNAIKRAGADLCTISTMGNLMQTERYQRVAEVVEARVGDKAFLLHVQNWVYLELNVTAGRIWELLEGERTVDDVTSDLVRAFAIDPGVCAADTAEFLEFLEEKHFVTRIAPA